MKIDSIKEIPNRVIDKCNLVGKQTVAFVRNIPSKADDFIKSDSFKEIKGKVNTKTVIGAGLIAGAVILAIGTIKTIAKELNKINNKP